MRRNKFYARFYDNLDKAQRVAFYKEAFPLMKVSHSSFYYKVRHGNLLPKEAYRIKDVLKKYGCTTEDLLSLGVVE